MADRRPGAIHATTRLGMNQRDRWLQGWYPQSLEGKLALDGDVVCHGLRLQLDPPLTAAGTRSIRNPFSLPLLMHGHYWISLLTGLYLRVGDGDWLISKRGKSHWNLTQDANTEHGDRRCGQGDKETLQPSFCREQGWWERRTFYFERGTEDLETEYLFVSGRKSLKCPFKSTVGFDWYSLAYNWSTGYCKFPRERKTDFS
jgi:hypothetical protein